MSEPQQTAMFTPAEIHGLECELLDGRLKDALSDSAMEEKKRDILRCIAMHRGAANAITASSVLSYVHLDDDEPSRRFLKGCVEDFVKRYRVPVGASRYKPAGYFLIVSTNDVDVAIGPLVSEIRSLAKRVKVLTSPGYVANLFRQVAMNFDEEKAA